MKFLVIMIFIYSCSSVPDKGISKITREGILNRTGVELPKDQEKNKDFIVQLPPGIELHNELSADDSAAIALWNNPQYSTDLALLGISRGDLMDAGQLRNPRVDILTPVGHKPFELLLGLPLEVIWERPARVAAAEKAYEQLATGLIQNGLNTVLDAHLNFINLVQAKKREEILSQAVELRKRIAQINMNQRVRYAELTEAEGIATEVDSASSEELWVRAKHDTYLALERYKLALGIVFEKTPLKVSTKTELLSELPSVEELEKKAFDNRPDLKALEIGILAAAKRADWEDARIAQLSFLLSSKGIGDYGVLTGPGFSVEIPIFHQNNGRRERADAEVEWSTRQFLTLKQRVAFEVREARELLVQAQEVLNRTNKNVLPLLEKTVKIAEKQYKTQTASYLFVLEQTRSLVDAQLRAVDFEAGVLRAQSQLKRAVGGRL